LFVCLFLLFFAIYSDFIDSRDSQYPNVLLVSRASFAGRMDGRGEEWIGWE
jgi:hypothetical protein